MFNAQFVPRTDANWTPLAHELFGENAAVLDSESHKTVVR